MSPLNPNAVSFLPNSLSSPSLPFIQFPTPTVPPPLLLLPDDLLPVLPQYPPPPPPHLQTFYNYPYSNQQICYGFPPPPPPSKLLSDYTHHGSLKMVATFDVYKGKNHGYSLKSSTNNTTGRSRSKKQQLPPTPTTLHRRQIHSSISNTKKQWQRKSVGGNTGAPAVPANVVELVNELPIATPSDPLEPIQRDGKKTSVMIRNIPNRYNREMLLELLVDHCKKENGKEEEEEEDFMEKDLSSAFDFVYLPIDFETGCNKGYAFVNFTNPNGVWRLCNSLNYYKWDIFNSRKICEVTYARIQGKDDLIKHFNRSTFACEKDEYLPVYFNPYRDGSVQDETVEVFTVGTRLLSSSSRQFSILRRGDHTHQHFKRNHHDNGKEDSEDEQPRTMS